MSQPVDVYAWRDAILSEYGPGKALTRSVLLAVAKHMKSDGTRAWPSQARIAVCAGVGVRTAKRHLEAMEKQGWVQREKRQVDGKTWRRTYYEASVPDDVYDLIPQRPWEADPEFRRGATAAPRDEEPALQTESMVPTATARSATCAVRRASSDQNEVPQLGPLTLHLNSTKNSPVKGARSRAPYLDHEPPYGDGDEREQRVARARLYLKKFPQYRSELATLAKFARCSLDEVQQAMDT